jgi:hypothetical protein
MLLQGNIPKQITYVLTLPKEQTFSLGEEAEETITVTPSFISDASNQRTLETGRKWARRGFFKFIRDPFGSEIVQGPVFEQTVTNEPIFDVRILGLEQRGNGGRAYKVLLNETYLVDLREDVLMETMLKHGVSPGRKLGGSFIWAKVSNQMKLVLVTGEIEKSLTKIEQIKQEKKPIVLTPGGIYSTSSKVYIYFGHDLKSKKNVFVEIYTFLIKGSKTIEKAAKQQLEPSKGYLWKPGHVYEFYDTYSNFAFLPVKKPFLEQLGMVEGFDRDGFTEKLKQSIKIRCDNDQEVYKTQVPENYYLNAYLPLFSINWKEEQSK